MSARTVIAAVRTDPADPALVRLQVDGTWIGPLRRDQAEHLGAEAGVRWTRTLERKVRELTDAAACRTDALRRLGRRDLTRALLAARLAPRWGEPLATRVVEELAAEGWLDDRAYAQRRAESLRRDGAVARERVVVRLEAEGVASDAARELAGAPDRPEDLAPLVRRWKREGRDAAAILRALGRRGFDFDTIAGALRAAGLPCPDLD